MLRVLPVVLSLALSIYCVIDCVRTDERRTLAAVVDDGGQHHLTTLIGQDRCPASAHSGNQGVCCSEIYAHRTFYLVRQWGLSGFCDLE